LLVFFAPRALFSAVAFSGYKGGRLRPYTAARRCRPNHQQNQNLQNVQNYKKNKVGGIVLHEGQVAEMRTGEGKTLVAVLAAYLNALPPRQRFDTGSSSGGGSANASSGSASGSGAGDGNGLPPKEGGVHVVTVNDYLAARDAEWMGRVYRCAVCV
jgi:hypothetical protein